MTLQQKVKFIREKVIDANPEKLWKNECESNQCDAFFTEPIRLADVLLAILEFDKKTPIENTGKLIGLLALYWNLKDNNLENQSEETIDFIYDILK